MSSRLIKTATTLTLVFLAVMMPVLASAGSPGESGILSLRMPVGGRETAMGGAATAAAGGASAVFWNPAILAMESNSTDILLQHQTLYGGLFEKETAVMAHRTDRGAFGFFFSGLYSDLIPRFGEAPVDVPEGSFEPYQVAFGISYSRRVTDTLALGVGAKLLHEEIDVYGGTGMSYDVSLFHQAVIPGFRIGASLANFGPDMTINTSSYKLPTIARVGFAFDPQYSIFSKKLTLAFDLVFPNDGNEKAHAGME
jgi:hypothetical protein